MHLCTIPEKCEAPAKSSPPLAGLAEVEGVENCDRDVKMIEENVS